MKQEQGLVLAVNNGMVKVRVGRHAKCSGCGACAGSEQIVIEAVSKLKVKPGQRVCFTLRDESMLKSAFVVFIMPLILTAIGAGLGYLVADGIGIGKNIIVVTGCVIFFLLSLGLIKFYNRKVGDNRTTKPVIIKILAD